MLNIGKRSLLVLADVALINLSFISALYFRFMKNITDMYMHDYIKRIIVITLIYIVSFYIFKLYESLWIYASLDEFILSISGCVAGTIMSIVYSAYTNPRVPYSVVILTGIFSVIYIFGFRISFRIYRRIGMYIRHMKTKEFKRALIIGAGSAGNIVINEMKNHSLMKYVPIGFIDDNKYKVGRVISGVKVLGDRKNIEAVVKEKKVDEIIIAIPSLNGNSKKEIIQECKQTGCRVKIIPGISDLIEGKISLSQIRDVQVEDLLGREPIQLENNEIKEYIKEKVVLVTGGGGSIGSELCRQIAKFKPKQLIILDVYENNAYDLQNELTYASPELNQKVLIACIRDRSNIDKIFSDYRPEVVFHAAAHKHVPLMEESPQEAIKNNVFGTLNVAECADKYKVKKFVMISTDKAVNPTNIMGASKRICEMIVQAMSRQSKTAFVAVRFGNVLGSNGSVIPLFKKQIAKGGPVTVTSKEVTRYFMTIPEASQLVLQAGAYAKGGEIFVLDMGKPVKIYDLACDLIRLSGFEPHKDIKINVTGLRPGEKLYEELLMEEEGLGKTTHNKIFVGRPIITSMDYLKRAFEEMNIILESGTKEQLVRKVRELVPGYNNPIYFEEVSRAKEEIAQTFIQDYEGTNGLGAVL
jgi:FlaA1/EpsC-like NDP-sugar epimerase